MENLNKQVHLLGRYADRLLRTVEHDLNESPLEFPSELEVVVDSLQVCQKALAKLKNYVVAYGFQSKAEEAFFFRQIKPLFYSKYIYYSQLHTFLLNLPLGGIKQARDFVEAELAELRRFFEFNRGFYQYYRSKATDLDYSYFTRQDPMTMVGTVNDHVADEQFSTPMDYTLSKLLASEKYQDYLNFQLSFITEGAEDGYMPHSQPRYRWTGSQTELVELLYALVAAGVLNHGTAEIKGVAAFFQGIFGMDLGSYYQKFGNITLRKKDPTAFMTTLKAALLAKIKAKLEEEPVTLKRIEFKAPPDQKSTEKKVDGKEKPETKPRTNPNRRKKPRK